MSRNLATSRRRWASGRPLDGYDRLPPELRRWLAEAALPWSPRSALRLWRRLARVHGGERPAMLAGLDRAEAGTLRRDCPQVWGPSYPHDCLAPLGRLSEVQRNAG